MRLEGGSDGNPRRNPIVVGCGWEVHRGRRGDKTSRAEGLQEHVSTRCLQAPARVQFPTGPRGNTRAARAAVQHTQDLPISFALMHAKMYSHTHTSSQTLSLTHTNRTRTQSGYFRGSRHGVGDIKAGQGVIRYLRWLHAPDSHQRNLPHRLRLAATGWNHISNIAPFSLL